MSRLKDRIAVVSGAAAGIGRAAAIRLAAEGAKIEILDIKNASEVCEEIRAADGVANSSICDVTNEAQIAESVKVIEQRHGHVDILSTTRAYCRAARPGINLLTTRSTASCRSTTSVTSSSRRPSIRCSK